MLYAQPGQPDAKVAFKSRYANFIGGEWTLRQRWNSSNGSKRGMVT